MKENENSIDKLLDVDNSESIILYDEKDNGIEFEQIALIPYQDKLYAMLKPVEKMDGVADDEAVIFEFEEDEQDKSQFLKVVNDDRVIDSVFAIYLDLLKQEDSTPTQESKSKKPSEKATSSTSKDKKAPAKSTTKAKGTTSAKSTTKAKGATSAKTSASKTSASSGETKTKSKK